MIKHVAGIIVVFVFTSFAWVILGTTVTVRTAQQAGSLRPDVAKLWGTPQRQRAPIVTEGPAIGAKPAKSAKAPATIATIQPVQPTAGSAPAVSPPVPMDAPKYPVVATAVPVTPGSTPATNGAGTGDGTTSSVLVPLDSSSVDVAIDLDHRQRGLIWYATYRVRFNGDYRITNRTKEPRLYSVTFSLPGEGAVYDNFRFAAEGKELENVDISASKAHGHLELAPGESKVLSIGYASQGLDEWWYDFGENVSQVRNFELRMKTSFADIDFPANAISPTTNETSGSGRELTWRYDNLLSGVQIGMLMPQKLNPGPWVSAITFFAPVSLFFFFFLLFIFSSMGPVRIHPMNYFFIGTGFFSFHLLLTYLVDHISIHAAFPICSVVSLFLVISYMRLVVGNRFAILQVGISQLIYLVFFSYTFFLESFTGLTVTVMCIVTLFIVMQMTGRLDWSKVFATSEAA